MSIQSGRGASINVTEVRGSPAFFGWLTEMGIDALYNSPVRRALQTAKAIGEATGLVPTVRGGLGEFDRERWDELATGSCGDAEHTAQFIATVNHAVAVRAEPLLEAARIDGGLVG